MCIWNRLVIDHHWENWGRSHLNDVLRSVVQMSYPGWERLTQASSCPTSIMSCYFFTHTACLQTGPPGSCTPMCFCTCCSLAWHSLLPLVHSRAPMQPGCSHNAFFVNFFGLHQTQSFPWHSGPTFRAHLTISCRIIRISACFTRMWALLHQQNPWNTVDMQ